MRSCKFFLVTERPLGTELTNSLKGFFHSRFGQRVVFHHQHTDICCFDRVSCYSFRSPKIFLEANTFVVSDMSIVFPFKPNKKFETARDDFPSETR